MLEITPTQVSRSMGGITAGVLAAHLLSVTPYYSDNYWDRGSNLRSFQISSMLSTFGSYSNAISAGLLAEDAPLIDFYSRLLASQQRLGAEFEEVLYGNLWELYAR